MKDFSAMNEVYTQYWGENKPSRTYAQIHLYSFLSRPCTDMKSSCVAVKQLPLGTDVEIECVAVLP